MLFKILKNDVVFPSMIQLIRAKKKCPAIILQRSGIFVEYPNISL